jgi:hypothetical protein
MSKKPVVMSLAKGRLLSITIAGGAQQEPACLRVLDAAGRVLHDDRLLGLVRCGPRQTILAADSAESIELFRANAMTYEARSVMGQSNCVTIDLSEVKR